MLGGGPAQAFDCAGVTFPSTIVICSDPGLMRLADERQAAINEARARIGEAAWPALWDDQKRWVRSYAAACGVREDKAPLNPVPPGVKECFRRAGLARIAYLRAYGTAPGGVGASALSPAPSGRPRVGPSFDCGTAASPLTLLICSNPQMSRLDLSFNQAYWALYQQVGPTGQPALREQDIAFIDQVEAQCGLPQSGPLTMEERHSLPCVEAAYENMRNGWLARLQGPAREEAGRRPEEHIRLQEDLQQLGFLPAGAVDGVYGRDTRSAIVAWQNARGRAVTGFLDDADARAIDHEATATATPALAVTRPAVQALGTEDIALDDTKGTLLVPVRIDGTITLPFILDSGAADVLLPADVVLTLWRAGKIGDGDFIGDKEYVLADGSTLKSANFVLRRLQVGDLILRDVTASIGSVNSQPLLGQSFLSRLGSWSIDNTRHVLRLSGLGQ
jgi:uncharacterized protein/predicted aspartyl protease